MFRKQKRFHQLGVILKYLKSSGCIESLKKQCTLVQENKYGVYLFTVPVDLIQLAELDSTLANFVISQPLDSTSLFQEVVYEVLLANGLLLETTDISQLAISLRVTASPAPQVIWKNVHQLGYSGLQKLRGVIIGMTANVSYTKSTKYICPNKDCTGHASNQYNRIHVPGASEKETVGCIFNCCVCKTKLEEVKSQRTLSEKLLVEMVPVHSLQWNNILLQKGTRHQTVSAIVRDDLCKQIQLGQLYEMTGTQRVDFEVDSIHAMFEVNNVMMVHELTYILKLPCHVDHLYTKWYHTPGAFCQVMALSVGVGVCPPACYFKLKLLLLISVVLKPEVFPLHILALCHETHIIQRLLELVSGLAIRTTYHSSLCMLGARVSTNRHLWAPYFIQAGSLVLAGSGVCRVGDIRIMKRSDKQELQTVLSEGQIQIALESRYTGSLPHVLSVPLSCQVWAYASHEYDMIHTNSLLINETSSSDLPTALLDAFSFVCYCDAGDSSSSEITNSYLISHLLAKEVCHAEERSWSEDLSMTNSHVEFVSVDDLKQYTAFARSKKSAMTVEAEWILTSYLNYTFKARRHSSSVGGVTVPINALQTLKALAHGLSQLSLRLEVLEEDALMAVQLYEETLSSKLGVSGLNVFPNPHLPNISLEDYLTIEQPEAMRQLRTKLHKYCFATSVLDSTEE